MQKKYFKKSCMANRVKTVSELFSEEDSKTKYEQKQAIYLKKKCQLL